MASQSSKVLGVRMPFPIYLELLEKAQELRMPISDLGLQLIVYNKDKPFAVQRLPDTSKELTDTKNALKALELKFNEATRVRQQYAKVEAQDKAKIKQLTSDYENLVAYAESNLINPHRSGDYFKIEHLKK
jgi:hypothetical protein